MAKRADRSWAAYAAELGHNLHRARAARGLSQERVAHLAGMAGFTYQKYEKGESRPGTPINLQLRSLVSLSQVLQVPVADLLPDFEPDLNREG
ncbi:helix-turn-helix domain-containing protein [Nocardioides caeni]|uniref:Helix-turn-helix transcriptional regulator n=1 Tax=Nocardioides caeni TaxID=574700 RepID=A0A4S8NLQ0_9ACTN|nr:helix-turn-helix transcriptional regulator [Nocardioides caeni]THV17798.1 helix-turn-helix transcriptional regulator [Nocardioides caeni]